MRRLHLALALVVAVACGPVVAAAGCQSFPPLDPCNTGPDNELPDGGCPSGRGGTCADPTCNALYDCVDSNWTLVQTCPAPDGGTGGESGLDDGGGDASDSDACTPVKIDLSSETTDCTPDLENPPDCPIQAALDGCAQSACLTMCSDFWLCEMTSMGPNWVDVAYCTCDGQFIITQK